MPKPMSKPRHTKRNASGHFVNSPPCDGCGKPAGTDPMTDEEVCGYSDGPGFNICDRKKCRWTLSRMSVEERRALYTEMRRTQKQKEVTK